MTRSVVRVFRFVTVTVGIVVLTSFTIDATDTLRGSNTALSLLARKATEAGCPTGTVRLDLTYTTLCVDQYENATSPSCPVVDPTAAAATQENLNDTACVAISTPERLPWTYVSYHQAKTLCAKKGMRLPSADEWYEAALGTPDTGACVITGARQPAGTATACQSARGVFDAIGNVWEWVDESVDEGVYRERTVPPEGYVASVDTAGVALTTSSTSDEVFGNDYVWFAEAGVYGMLRGGFFGSGEDAGMFTVQAKVSPSFSSPATGFRCVSELSRG